jgi:hypothetical protein
LSFDPLPSPTAARPTPDWLGKGDRLDWSWAVEQLTKERNYWITTLRKDGLPQARPVWGLWNEQGLYLSVGHGGVQRANGKAPFPASVHVDSAIDVVILEGTLHRLKGAEADDLLPEYNAKYSWDMSSGGLNFILRPDRAYGWANEDVGTATRWNF